MKQILPLIIGSSLVLASCANTQNSSAPQTTQSYSPRADNAFLSQAQAEYRSQRIADVNYALDFNLTGEETFNATATLNFNLTGIQHPITIDLNKAEIKHMSVNGNQVEANYNQSFITVSPVNLHNGNNSITIDYQRKHSTNGEGLHRFEDPVDGKVYLYSHFEPAAAHQMFPSFDQPDLKATYTVTATAPQDWHVITTQKELSTKQIDNKKRWNFGPTPKLSPYNFSLHAGPYKMWQDNSGKYPARLFARQSVAKQVVPEDWFTYTKQGLVFFEQYFGIPYPFKKYDQLLVPDFLYGAMENAAAVTFAERGFLTNGKMSRSRKENLAMVIMHEMAHQWFGDLVTMKWWNGLWLNESFAAFMATLATAQATEFENAWRTFYAFGKQSAYRADQRVTTHPIEVPVPSTANAFDNIDAITYSKGASVLNQLRYLLGPDTFQKGVHNYLTEYSYKNASLDDFINSLAKTANRDLSQWKQEWLYQPGVNTITADYQCQDDKISAFALKQSAGKQYPVLREQRVNIALLSKNSDGHLQMSKAQDVIYRGEKTEVGELIGSSCPDLVYPNYQDWAFVKVNLDKQSFATTKSALSQVTDPLLRSMLWQSLWDSVRDGLLPLNEYLMTASQNIANEKDGTILNQVLSTLNQGNSMLAQFGDQVAQYRPKANAMLEKLAWQAVMDNQENSQRVRVWFNAYSGLASSEQALSRLKDILAGKLIIRNLEVSQDLRWRIIRALNTFNAPGSLALIDDELQRDSSDSSQKRAIAAKVVRPDVEQKQYWLAQIHSDKSEYSFPKLRIIMSNLYPANQGHLAEQTADSIITSLLDVDKKQNPVFMRTYAGTMIPSTCTPGNEQRLAKAIADNPDLSAGTMRALRIYHQGEQRCLSIAKAMTAH